MKALLLFQISTIGRSRFSSARRWLILLAMDGQISDQDLMLRYGSGDASAFTELYARHKGPLFRYFVRQCYQKDLAEELFQETWTRVINAREKYQPSAKFTTWMYRIAHNLLMDHGRKVTRQPTMVVVNNDDEPQVISDPDASPSDQTNTAMLHRRLMRALAQLPNEQREAFLLKEESGLTLKEISVVLGIGQETVKSRLRYALKKLRADLAGEQESLI